MKGFKLLLGVLMLAGLSGWLASPYWVLYQINQAIEHNQPGKLSAYIDYPAVRQSLKDQLAQRLQQKLGIEQQTHALEVWGAQLSTGLTAYTVDLLVQPDTIVWLLQGKEWTEAIRRTTGKYSTTTQTLAVSPVSSNFVLVRSAQAASPAEPPIRREQAHYLGLNTFQVRVPTGTTHYTDFIFNRSGLSWKMTAIHLPAG